MVSGLTKMQTLRIWQQAPHNAFTDLIYFHYTLWCVFREGSAHVSPDGQFRILRSLDGIHWLSSAVISMAGADLRDAKFSLLPDGRLMLYGAGALHDKSQQSHQSFAWFSDNGLEWSAPVAIGEPNFWLWRLAWFGQQALAVSYHCGQPRLVKAYQTRDARHFVPLGQAIYQGSYANESAICFEPDGTALCLLRRDPENGLLGVARPPYHDWQWTDIGCRIGGPAMLRLADGQLLVCVRLYDQQVRTSLCKLDRLTGKLTELQVLPSGGDCSYAGMVLRENSLYISYYSSHEQRSAIYVTRLELRVPSGANFLPQ